MDSDGTLFVQHHLLSRPTWRTPGSRTNTDERFGLTHMHSLSDAVATSSARSEAGCSGVSGPALRALHATLLLVLSASVGAAAAMSTGRSDTCFTPAMLSSLHCSEQNCDTSCRCRLHTEQREAPTAPLGGRGCGRRRRKMTLELLMV